MQSCSITLATLLIGINNNIIIIIISINGVIVYFFRTLMFIKNSFGGVVPDCTLDDELQEVLVCVNRELARYTDCLGAPEN